MDEFDPLMINHGTFLSPAESENVARMPVHEESDTDLTDTELEDNNSLETQTEVGDDDRKPKAKPSVAGKKPTIQKAPRKVTARRQSKKKLPTARSRISRPVVSEQPRKATGPEPVVRIWMTN